MQGVSVCVGQATGTIHNEGRHNILHRKYRTPFQIHNKVPKNRVLVVRASSGTPKNDGFSGRDFLAEFDDLLKFKPADKEQQQQQQQSKTSSALSDLFRVIDEKKRSEDAKNTRLGTFKSRDTEVNQGKPVKTKKERITNKFFGTNPTRLEVKEIVDAFKKHETDVGSSPVQIALLTQRIKYVAAHLKDNKKDFSSQRGLKAMVDKRKKHLIYLRRTDMDTFKRVIAKLGLKDNLDKDRIAAASRKGR